MKEQIKQEVEDWAKETSQTVNSEANRLHGANHVIDTYYYPLIEAVEKLRDSKQHDKHWARVETIILNAKKLIKMNTQEIKEKVLYDDCGFIRLSEYCVDTILKDYYTPLAESHRELINIIENYRSNFPQTFDEVENALSNAKKLINE